jgi:hypothetical protein
MILFNKKPKAKNQPKKYTQADLVLAVLQTRGPTTTDIFEYMGVKSPSTVIHRLRKSGHNITTKRIWKKTFKYSWPLLQAEYTLHVPKRPLFGKPYQEGGK